MADNFQEFLIREIRQILDPLEGAARSEEERTLLFKRLGWNIENLDNLDGGKLAGIFTKTYSAIDELLKNPPQSLYDIVRVLLELTAAFDGIRNLGRLAKREGDLPQEFSDIGEDLIESLITDYLQTYHPKVYYLCVILTLIQDSAEVDPSDMPPPVLVNDQLVRFVQAKNRLTTNNLGALLKDPIGYLRKEYWSNDLATSADADLVADRLLRRAAWLLRGIPHIRATYGISKNLKEQYGWDWGTYGNRIMSHALTVLCHVPKFSIDKSNGSLSVIDDAFLGATFSLSSQDCENLGLVITPWGDFSLSTPIGQWLVLSELSASSEKAFAIGPTGFQLLVGGNPNVKGALKLRRLPSGENEPTILFGGTTGTRLEVSSVQISGAIDLSEQSLNGGVVLEVGKSTAVVQAGDGDGFLQQILPKQDIRVDFDLAMGWSNTTGFYLRGGAGLESTLPTNLQLFNSIRIDSVYLALRTTDKEDTKKNGAIQAVVATTATVQLGPVSAVVERFGLQATLSFPKQGGNLGVANLDLGFKSPNGVGLAIKAQAVTGSGYLSYDSDTEQYTGLLQLEIAEKISLSAVGLLTTRMPDGSKGFSLLVLMSARFEPGIQLGYGFTLHGLGGLLGVNRTVSVDVLRDGLRSGAFSSILFPRQVIENATQIVSNLSTIFPPASDRFLFGPMAIIHWGEPSPLLRMELGIVLEVPEPARLLVMGRLRVTLPNAEGEGGAITGRLPSIRLQLDALGVIDFESGNISLDAVLYDSVIGSYAVTGEMALRANFGAQPMFLLAVGGFHPAFQAPAGFPTLERVTFSLAKHEAGAEVRLQLAAYVAVTSNTIQFGAHLDLLAQVGKFQLAGQLGFDALIHLQPFGLLASFQGAIAVKVKGTVLTAVMLQMNLTGPSPWHAWGKATFKFLLLSATKEFDVHIGDSEPPPLPPPMHVLDELVTELVNSNNWSSLLPPGQSPLVTFRTQPVPTQNGTGQPPLKPLLIHPLAELQVSQRRVPLDDVITRFNNSVLEEDTRFTLTAKRGSGTTGESVLVQPVSDWFAPAQFHVRSDAEQLAAPSFSELHSGIRLGAPNAYHCESVVPKELSVKSSNERDIPSPAPMAWPPQVAAFGAAGKAPIRATGPAKYRDPSRRREGMTLRPARFRVIAKQPDAVAIGESPDRSTQSYSAARLHAAQARLKNPQLLFGVVPDSGVVK